MAVRDERGAGLRRVAAGRAGFVALALVVYAAAGVAATWPAVLHARTYFLSGGAPGHGEASPGDHLQTLYHWWLVGHQLEHAHAPWLDPYSFRPEAAAQPNFPGWPFGFLFWPLGAIFGLVVAWNLMQLVLYVLAGLVTCGWLRELDLPRGAALAGGLVFAIAPYRVEQSVGHLLGPVSILLPLALWGVELARRRSRWWIVLAAAALASIPLSGQVHLALGAIPFFALYAGVRLRSGACWHRPNVHVYTGAAAAVLAAIGAGLLVRQTVIVRSTQAGGRSLDEVASYSARWSDFVTRHVDHARSEQFVFLGWLTPVLALLGLLVLLRTRRFGLAALFALGALVPILLALGTRLPLYSALWHAFPPFRFPRVPERLLPIACLCLAALVAFAVARTPHLAIAAVVVALLFVDLHVRVYGKSVADEDNAAYASAAGTRGRLLELPIFDPGVHYGSVYLWYDTHAHRQRPGGYSTTAPRAAKATARRLERLNCGDWSDDTAGLLRRMGVTTIAFHQGLFVRNGAVPDRRYFALRGLVAHGWSRVGTSDAVWMFTRATRGVVPVIPEPSRTNPVFCPGWYGNTGGGWPMSETHAPLWIYGAGQLRMRLAAPESLYPVRPFTVDGRVVRGSAANGARILPLGAQRRWHVVGFNVDHLVAVHGRKIGLTLVSLRVTSPSRGTRSRHRASSR